jgi:hypothetical protein
MAFTKSKDKKIAAFALVLLNTLVGMYQWFVLLTLSLHF